ncbi:MAG: HAD family phosphatase [Thermoleophilia bacterium]|nr:HAD family phosphatase [Thermoleophilia bacterium]
MALKCVYVDLDGTLLGAGASLFHDGERRVTNVGARAVEACLRADVELCIFSGRRAAQVHEAARLFGQSSFIFEVGCGLYVDGDTEWLTGGLKPTETQTIYQQIEAAGAPALLLGEFGDRLEHHAPWHLDREVSHLFRGWIDTDTANALLEQRGFGDLRLVDNGRIHRKSEKLTAFEYLHAYHLIPRVASKASGVARHMQVRGYSAEQVIACGDSVEDLEVAPVVGRFFVMHNAIERNSDMELLLPRYENATVTDAGHGAGVYEAIVGTLMER